MEDILAPVDLWTQDVLMELMKTEDMQLGLQEVTTSLHIWTKSLCKKIANTKQDLHTELNTMIQGTHVKIQMRTRWKPHSMKLGQD